MHRTWSLFAPAGTLILTLSLSPATMAQATDIAAPPQASDKYEVLTRGKLHEAFATPTTYDPVKQPIIQQEPPEPIEEVLPDHRPAGNNVIWIPGYWDYHDEEKDFVWISGLWRNVPPGRQWVPGYWTEADGGYRWVPGSWVRAGSEVTFYPQPPASQERGPSSRRPSENHFYVPGCWVYRDNDYKWRPGYWAPHQRDWIWVPARYTPAANGYLYSDGYWDYRLDRRGQLFAPVRFRNQAYQQADFRFGPTATIDSTSQLLLHLFVRPNRGTYVFGDYYEQDATPWFEYHRRDRGYDPLMVHYSWYNGPNFVQRLQGWHKYFSGNPSYRPRPTLNEQLSFARQNQDLKHLQQSVLGNTLDQLVSRNDGAQRFVQLGSDQLQRLNGISNTVRQLTGQRVKLESQVSADASARANQALRLPELPGIRAPQVGRDVPDLPSNLTDAAPQLPQAVERATRSGRDRTSDATRDLPRRIQRQVPVDIPDLPF